MSFHLDRLHVARGDGPRWTESFQQPRRARDFYESSGDRPDSCDAAGAVKQCGQDRESDSHPGGGGTPRQPESRRETGTPESCRERGPSKDRGGHDSTSADPSSISPTIPQIYLVLV